MRRTENAGLLPPRCDSPQQEELFNDPVFLVQLATYVALSDKNLRSSSPQGFTADLLLQRTLFAIKWISDERT